MVFLYEDEGSKLCGKQLILPQNIIDHLKKQQQLYSGKEYTQTKGYKRLNGLLNKSYNDPAHKKQNQHNDYTMSFADAKRMDFDMKHMVQSPKNVEYSMIGGDLMRNWLHNSLESLRNSVHKVDKVPEVPKLSQKDLKPKEPAKTVKVNGQEVTLENKEFNKLVKKCL